CSKNGGRVRIPNNRHISHPLRSEIVQEIFDSKPLRTDQGPPDQLQGVIVFRYRYALNIPTIPPLVVHHQEHVVIDVNVKDMEIDLSNLGTLNSIIAIIIRISELWAQTVPSRQNISKKVERKLR
ncbi:hypothetical protein M8C21_005338, partial [Ambrosia artemisiifolia]